MTFPPFVWGVASGDPTGGSVRLWTRIDLDDTVLDDTALGDTGQDSSLAVSWEIWDANEPAEQTRRSGVESTAADGTVALHVTGLTPGRRYSYRFGWNGSWSVTGSTATLDPAGETVRLGVACCARLASGSLTAYEGLRRAEPDLVVHLGDYIYEDGGRDGDEGDTPEPPCECHTFDEYSARYGQYRRDDHLQRLHRSIPWVLTPDDHEITDDAFPPEHQIDASSAAPSSGPPVDPPSPDRRSSALAAHQRWMPQAAHGNGPTAFDRHVPLGRVADLIMIDTRLGGREEPAGAGPTPLGDPSLDDQARNDQQGHRSLLGEAQWAWLDDVIGTADRPWLILASQVQVSPLRLGWLPRWSWPPRWGPVVNPDQWDGYPTDRERLVELLDRHEVDRVLIISGDLHARFVSTIERNHGDRIIEVTTPSVSAPTFASLIERRIPLPTRWGTWRLTARWLRMINPHIVEMDLDTHGTTLLEIDHESIVITAVSPTGSASRRWTVTAAGVIRTP